VTAIFAQIVTTLILVDWLARDGRRAQSRARGAALDSTNQAVHRSWVRS
jgi:hypothetical protein